LQSMDPRQLPLIPEVIIDRIERRKARMAELGAKGGRSKSPRKLRACTINLARAQAARWPGRPRVESHEG